MTTTAITSDTLRLLEQSKLRKDLIKELEGLKNAGSKISKTQMTTILGQWFHPLHYFPTFLSRLVSVAPDIDMQTYISRILWQELGKGDPKYAHEKIYLETVVYAGLDAELVANASPFEDTQKLIAGYQAASESYLPGLGFLYGTEVADLAMVSTIGNVMRECTGKQDLFWIDIHVEQEPDHVQSSHHTLQPSFSEEEQQQILHSAEQMWSLWIEFFKSIKAAIFV
ncbi:MAG: iron-containing redox enzyme family protein [Acidobacteriota bacterium]